MKTDGLPHDEKFFTDEYESIKVTASNFDAEKNAGLYLAHNEINLLPDTEKLQYTLYDNPPVDSVYGNIVSKKELPVIRSGQDGRNFYSITLYKHAQLATTVTAPSQDLIWNFSTMSFENESDLEGWSLTKPEKQAGYCIYATSAVANGNSYTDTIKSTEWKTPVYFEDSFTSATINLYKRSKEKLTKEDTPLRIEWDMLSGCVTDESDLSGWTLTVPENSGNDCYVISTVAIGEYFAEITRAEWSDPVVAYSNGFSPSIEVTESDDGTTITIRDINGEKSAFIKDGENGTPLTSKGEWDPEADYIVNDFVLFGPESYVCKKSCKGEIPSPVDNEYWDLLAAGATQYYVHYVYNDSLSESDRYSKNETRKYIGVYTDDIEEDADTFEEANAKDITWSQIEGDKGDKGDTGDSGIGYYVSSQDATESTTSLSVSKITIPEGRVLQSGDLVLAGKYYLFRITSLSSTSAFVSFINSIRGEMGASAYIMDLSNEVDSVPVTNAGCTEEVITLTTTLSLYYGTEAQKIVSAPVFKGGYPSTITPSHNWTNSNQTEVEITFTIAKNTNISKVNIIIAAESKYGELESVFSISGVKGGEDAVIYYLEPSDTVLRLKEDGTVYPATVTCKQYSKTGNKEPVESNVYLTYKIDNGTETAYTSAVTVPNSASFVTFTLYDNATDKNMLDREKIPLIADGANGDPADEYATECTMSQIGSAVTLKVYKNGIQAGTLYYADFYGNGTNPATTAGATGTITNGSATISAVGGANKHLIKVYEDRKRTKLLCTGFVSFGDTGSSSTSYWMVSPSTISRSKTGTLKSTSLEVTGYYKTGNGAPDNYFGRFKLEYTLNGTTWVTIATSEDDEPNHIFDIPSATYKTAVKFRTTMFLAGGTTTTLDQDEINVVNDGDDGISPTITTSKAGSTTTITITDSSGTKTATINDGSNGKSITNQGNWQSGKVYHSLDSVYYSVTGNSYLCNTEHTSSTTVTPESNNWTILAEKGEEGDAQFIHYVYADNPTASTSTAANYSKSETRKYVGVYRDNTEADADFDKLPSTITWSQIESDSTINYSISNPNPNVSCSNNGTVSTFEGTSTLISVFENETQLQYSTTAGNGKFKYTKIVPNGCACTTEPSVKGKDLSLPNLTAMTADNATRTVTIAGKFLDGTDFTLTVTQTFSKVKKGNDGNSLTITEQYTKYGSSTSGTVEPTTWVNNPPAVAQGNYLWTKNYKKYSDNKEETILGVEYQSKDGSNGYNIWNSSADATTTTTSIALNTVTVPSGYYVKAGDLIIASSLIFTVSSASASKATVTYQQSIKGSTGLSLECSVQSIKLNQRRNSTLDYDSQTFTCKLYRNLLSLTPSSCNATVSGTAGGVSVSANIVDSVCVVTVEASNGGAVCKDLIITVGVTCELKTYTFTVPVMAVTTGSYKGSKSTNEMPTASLSELGNYYCYIGEDGDYKKSYVYTCIRTGSSTYEWVIDNSDEANSVAFSDILSVIDNAEDKNKKSSLVVDRMVTSKLFAGFIAATKIQFQHYVASIQEENLKSGDLLINMGENPRSTDESFDYQFALRQYLGKFNNTEKLLELFSVSKDKNSDVNSKVNINGSLLANKLEVSDSAYITDGTIETVGDIGFSAAYICCVLKYNGYYWALSTTTKGTLKVYKVSDVYDFKNATVKYTRTIKNININDACVFNNRIVIASEDGIYTLDYYGTIKRVKEGSWGGILEMGDTLVFYAGSGGSSNNVHTTDLETFVTESYGYRSAVKSDDEYYYTSYGCKNVFNNNLNIYKVKKDGTLYGSINLKDKVIPGIEGGITLLGEVACANNVIFCNIIVQQQSSTSRDEYSIYSIDCGETFNLIKNEDGTTINFEFGLRSFYINGLYILQSGFGLCYITSDLKKFTQIGSKDSNDYSDNYVLKPIMIDTEDDIGFYLGGKGYEDSSQMISNYWLYGIHKRKYGSYIKKDITDDLVFNASFYTGASTVKNQSDLKFKVFKNESYECGKHTVYIIKIMSNIYNWYYGKTGSVTIGGLTGLSKENISVSISMKSSSPTGGLESSYKITDDNNIRFALYNRNEGTQFTLPTFDIKIEIWE